MIPAYEIFLKNNCENNCMFFKSIGENEEILCSYPFITNPKLEEFAYHQRRKEPCDWTCGAYEKIT